jgi:cystathionine beta-lyase/cystathionine gamma-synthase
VYGATEHLAESILSRFGIGFVEVDTSNLNAVEDVVKTNPKAKAILFETPTNPMLAITDIPALVKIVKNIAPEMKVVVDNTFATPYLQRPLIYPGRISGVCRFFDPAPGIHDPRLRAQEKA